jgi:hypothetical protein
MIREHLASKFLTPGADIWLRPAARRVKYPWGVRTARAGAVGRAHMRPCQQSAARVPVRAEAIGETTVKRGWFGSNC